MKKPIKIYLGAPLFNEMEQDFNHKLASIIRDEFGDQVELYVPQENEALNDKSGYAGSVDIYQGDTDKLKETDILIAVLDGQTVDVGLATEIGYFARMAEEDSNKRLFGLYTDIRQGHVTGKKVKALNRIGESVFSYVNLYTIGAIKASGFVYNNKKDMIAHIKHLIDK